MGILQKIGNQILNLVFFIVNTYFFYVVYKFLTPTNYPFHFVQPIYDPEVCLSKYLDTNAKRYMWNGGLLFLFFFVQLFIRVYLTRLSRMLGGMKVCVKITTTVSSLAIIAIIICWVPLINEQIYWQFQSALIPKLFFIFGFSITIYQLVKYYLMSLFEINLALYGLFDADKLDIKSKFNQLLSRDKSPIFLGPILILFSSQKMTLDRLVFALVMSIYLLTTSLAEEEDIQNGKDFMSSTLHLLWEKSNPYNIYNRYLQRRRNKYYHKNN
ncbi:nurim [Anaeramoeba flamelloides]|uniref:Nuclear envelope membrane protein n=1 Tax=Anaeramoeba flamelloides TaxID=1746091 RepID=A0AAV7Y6J3_9EUKA|nr:nurim [Anaeramoeba flamelloides]